MTTGSEAGDARLPQSGRPAPAGSSVERDAGLIATSGSVLSGQSTTLRPAACFFVVINNRTSVECTPRMRHKNKGQFLRGNDVQTKAPCLQPRV